MVQRTVIAVVLFAAAATVLPAAHQSTPPPKPFDCSGPEYRQFDFWIGDWDVVLNPATTLPAAKPQPGRKPGRNIVEKIQGGCVILENWDDQQGGTGQSFNLYDRVTQKWHQTWVSNNGSLHQYWGGLDDGNMVYVGEVPLGPAMRFQGRRTVRVTFTPMGRDKLRQFSESLNSDGTWTPNYDLLYSRRPSTK